MREKGFIQAIKKVFKQKNHSKLLTMLRTDEKTNDVNNQHIFMEIYLCTCWKSVCHPFTSPSGSQRGKSSLPIFASVVSPACVKSGTTCLPLHCYFSGL